MAKKVHRLPKADRIALSKTKEQILDDHIKEVEENVAYYNKVTRVKFPLGLLGIAVLAALSSFGINLTGLYITIGLAVFLNGIGWWFTARSESKKLKKMLDIRTKRLEKLGKEDSTDILSN